VDVRGLQALRQTLIGARCKRQDVRASARKLFLGFIYWGFELQRAGLDTGSYLFKIATQIY
jgi:hypothetical protein